MSTIASDETYSDTGRILRGARYQELSSFARSALDRDKQEGLQLSVRARWAALATIALLLLYLNPRWEVIYYEVIIAGFAVIGWAQLQIGRAGRSGPELLLLFLDLALMTLTVGFPNPFREFDWSPALQFRFSAFMYFYVLLAAAMLSYSWRTVLSMGTWTAGLWVGAIVWAYFQPDSFPELTQGVMKMLTEQPEIFEVIDPSSLMIPIRVQEIVVFLIVASVLALGNWRANRLVMNLASMERERTNLARYFSPNVVDELAHHDEPLKQIRTQNVAVLFADIVGFTRFAEDKEPEQVIGTLREFHGVMEQQVFGHDGTLDKYLGDGLMATFGTPTTGKSDASNALRCARNMIVAIDTWNSQRRSTGLEPIEISIGIHFGIAVLGDIGANRLEFAVIGNTVNVASRLEAMTRRHATRVIASDDLMKRIAKEMNERTDLTTGFEKLPPQDIRGLAQPVPVWKLNATN